tara:strand:+ start:20646 stop:21023 length:378 start_codon:yes stop_codon:yes gene_type:complete
MSQIVELMGGRRLEHGMITEGRIRDATSTGYNVEAIASGKTLTTSDAKYQKLDPAGGGRTVVLPAEADSKGLEFYIMNDADASEAITVNNDAAGTIVTIPQNEAALVVCNGTTWIHLGILTIQRS